MPGLPATPSCVLTSEQEEGPYYVQAAKFRSDITEGKPGIPLLLRVQVRLCGKPAGISVLIVVADGSRRNAQRRAAGEP